MIFFSQYVTLYIYICTNKYRPFLHDQPKKEKEGLGRSIQKGWFLLLKQKIYIYLLL